MTLFNERFFVQQSVFYEAKLGRSPPMSGCKRRSVMLIPMKSENRYAKAVCQ